MGNANTKGIYLDNVEILSTNLIEAIEKFITKKGEIKYVHAYLFGTVGAISSYFEFLKKSNTKLSDDEMPKAYQFAFNLLKHNPNTIAIVKRQEGRGMSFPFGGAPIIFTQPDVVWISDISDRKRDNNGQKQAYMKLLAGKSVIQTTHNTIAFIKTLENNLFGRQ